MLVDSLTALQEAVAQTGFAFVRGAAMHDLLTQAGPLSDWDEFSASWNHLAVDTHMADGGRYRRRRHAVYAAAPNGSIVRAPDQPHFQTIEHNPLNGGVVRWFEPIVPAIGSGPTMRAILVWSRALFERLAPIRAWHVEAHQFRIEARPHELGKPTPEGRHRDGVDFVVVLLIGRENVDSGTTSVHALDGRTLGSFTLATPLDAAIVDDTKVAHGVTPIERHETDRRGYRDVLVVTFRRRP